MSGFDPHTLGGAYALNAIDDELERRRFEHHLAGCEECALEISTLSETAARLGSAVSAEPPAELRERVMARIEQVRQVPPAVARPRSRPMPWLTLVGVAAALVAVVVLGVTALQSRGQLEEARAIAAVMTAPDARTVTAANAGGVRGSVLVSRSQGRMVFWASGLADPPAGRAYQLWRLAPGRIESAGLLTVDSGRTPPVLTSTQTGVAKIGVTQEPAGGSKQPTSDPMLLVDVPA